MTAQPKTATIDRPEDDAAARPMRADAKRNYELLVTAARKVFDQEGGGASMEAIAKEAGVGIGTLYRHFPKRIDVVEAVYRRRCRRARVRGPHGERRPGAVARARGLARGLRPLRERQEAVHERAARGVREGPRAALGLAGADRGRPGHRADPGPGRGRGPLRRRRARPDATARLYVHERHADARTERAGCSS